MSEEEETKKDLTAPPYGKTHEATTPPGQGDRDEDAVRKAQEKLDQATSSDG
jgi:hypothetical protein